MDLFKTFIEASFIEYLHDHPTFVIIFSIPVWASVNYDDRGAVDFPGLEQME